MTLTFRSGQGDLLSRQKATGAGLRSGGQIDSDHAAKFFQITNVQSSSSYHTNSRN